MKKFVILFALVIFAQPGIADLSPRICYVGSGSNTFPNCSTIAEVKDGIYKTIWKAPNILSKDVELEASVRKTGGGYEFDLRSTPGLSSVMFVADLISDKYVLDTESSSPLFESVSPIGENRYRLEVNGGDSAPSFKVNRFQGTLAPFWEKPYAFFLQIGGLTQFTCLNIEESKTATEIQEMIEELKRFCGSF